MSADQTNVAVKAAVAEIVTSAVAGKKFYESKTFWANVVMALAITVQSKYGFVVGAEIQALVISAINLGLRKISSKPVVW